MENSLKGHLLIASPKLRDPNFFRSVVLIVQHNEQSALGLVLNRPLDVTIQKAWRQLSQSPCQIEGDLLCGGPCEGVLMALHTDVEASDIEVIDGVHFSTSKDALEHIVSHDGGNVRLFVGYAGWSPGQLEAELTDGAWQIARATSERVFHCEDSLWDSLRHSIGRETLTQRLNPKIVPDDPSVN